MDEQGDSVGVGRYEDIGDGVAEVAIVVEPSWRRLGVGSMLLRLLEEPARTQGFSELLALYLPSNGAVEDLLLQLGYTDRTYEDDVVALRKPLP